MASTIKVNTIQGASNTATTIKTNGGTDAITVNTSGNVGIGETDISSFGGVYRGLDVAYKGSGLAGRTNNPTFDMRSNIYYDGSNYKYGEGSTSAGILSIGGNQLTFSNAPNGTAGATATVTERLRAFGDGRVSIGTATANAKLYLYANSSRSEYSGGWMQRIHNDGNANNLYGLEIMVGKDDGSGTNSAIRIATGDGSDQGEITFSGGTVTYGAFTAMHHCIIPDADNTPTSLENAYPYGTLLEVTSIEYTKLKSTGADTERGIVYNVKKTQSANSKKVLGAYGSSMNQGPSEHTNMHQVLVLGDGHILCNNSGGNISIGDGVCSSSTEGIGCKATANPSMIIGLAQEDITFTGSETKLVPVQYGLRQFTPWS